MKNSQRLFEPNTRPFVFFLIVFAVATLVTKNFYLAAAEGVVILALIIYSLIMRSRRRKALLAYIESVTYDAETAKNNTLLNFPLPIVVFRLDDSRIIWGNEMFFSISGLSGTRTDISLAELIPEFSGKWLMEGKTQSPDLFELNGKKYQICGNIVRSGGNDASDQHFMAIAYWIDVTEYENIRDEHELSKPVAAILTIDNYEELMKNQPERVRNDLRDAVGDKLDQWGANTNGIIIRFDRDRYLFLFEDRYMQGILSKKCDILNEVHQVVSPSGIHATLSIGIGRDGANLSEALQFASLAVEMALSRGGDQAVIKNKFSFDFIGGKSGEVESSNKVRSRVMANALESLIKDASRVLVMGHKFSDMDSIGGAVGICSLARKNGKSALIVADTEKSSAKPLIRLLRESPEYKEAFISAQEAIMIAEGKTLLVVVDTNRPEQVEDLRLLQSCNHVAVIDHHRRAATYIDRADLSFIEPYASSVCELMTEILEMCSDEPKLLRCEAEAILAGIVLDTKSFTLRTGDRTFDAAAYLRRAGADTVAVKKLMQNGMEQTVAKYKILQRAQLYRSMAVAVPETPQNRIVAAQAADELLNVAGVDASMVMYPTEDGGVFVSARSIGDVNVQLIMEKLGGGGNRAAAAAQINGLTLKQAVEKLYAAIDEYIDS